MKIGPLVIRFFQNKDAVFANSKLGKNYAFELLLLGLRPKCKTTINLDFRLTFNKMEDHSPSMTSSLCLFRLLICEFNVYNIHHALNEVDKELGVVWEWVEKDKTWYAKFPVQVNGKPGEWLVWLTQRPHYCDRGRWSVGVDGIGCDSPDAQEGFNRYFFDLDTAKDEMREWIKMRQEIIKKTDSKA